MERDGRSSGGDERRGAGAREVRQRERRVLWLWKMAEVTADYTHPHSCPTTAYNQHPEVALELTAGTTL